MIIIAGVPHVVRGKMGGGGHVLNKDDATTTPWYTTQTLLDLLS